MKKALILLLIMAMMYTASAVDTTSRPVACTMDAKMCPDGSYVGRMPPDCKFQECPTIKACPADAKICPDGTSVGRSLPDCEFQKCPTEERCAEYTKEGKTIKACATCGNGACEPYEKCTSSSCSGDICTSDCGQLYCPEDCEENPVPKQIAIPEDFWLDQGNYVIVINHMGMRINLDKVVSPVTVCKDGETCKKALPYVVLGVTFPGDCPLGVECMVKTVAVQEISLAVGETKDVNGVRFGLIQVEGTKAYLKVALVEEPPTSTGKEVQVPSTFSLEENTVATVTNYRDLQIILEKINYDMTTDTRDDRSVTLSMNFPGCQPTADGREICIKRPSQQYILKLGETLTYEGIKLGLVRLDGKSAKFKIAFAEEDCKYCNYVPTCQKQNGVEGWYARGELVKEDRCLCRAECRNIGSRSEGFYSTCTDELIVYTVCKDAKEVIPLPMQRDVQVRQTDSGYEVSSGEVAVSKIAISVNEDRLEMATESGNKELKVMPDEARATAVSHSGMQQVNSIEIISEGDRPVYKVSGTVVRRLLWIIPYTTTEEVYVDAESSEILTS